MAARLHNFYWSLGTVAFIIVGSYLVGRSAQAIAGVRGAGMLQRRRVFWGYALASPWLLGFAIFVLGPAVLSLYYSFTDYRLGRSLEWIGLENYKVLLGGLGAQGRRFMQAMYNSGYYALGGSKIKMVVDLYGGWGNDLLNGDDGDDSLYGGPGHDHQPQRGYRQRPQRVSTQTQHTDR